MTSILPSNHQPTVISINGEPVISFVLDEEVAPVIEEELSGIPFPSKYDDFPTISNDEKKVAQHYFGHHRLQKRIAILAKKK